MKTRLLIIVVFAMIPFVFLNVDASCVKQVGHADESCTPAELLEICHTLWSPSYDGSALGHVTRDIAIVNNFQSISTKFITGSGAAKILKNLDFKVEDVYTPPQFVIYSSFFQ